MKLIYLKNFQENNNNKSKIEFQRFFNYEKIKIKWTGKSFKYFFKTLKIKKKQNKSMNNKEVEIELINEPKK